MCSCIFDGFAFTFTGNLCSKSLCAIGHAKLDVDRSRSSCQVAAGSSSSDVEGTFCDSPEGVLLAEELP